MARALSRSMGCTAEGLAAFDRTVELARHMTFSPLLVELWFYAFAHQPAPEHPPVLQHLRRLLEHGAQSTGRDLHRNVAQARAEGHPGGEWLEHMAAAAPDVEDLPVLDAWPAWKVAGD